MRRFLALALLVLATCALAAAPAWADAPIYYVQYGDTLFSIAQHYGVSVEALRAANGLYGNLIYAGQALTIPTGNGHPAPPSGSTVAHVAQYGETLFSIGLRYGLQWTVIAQANGLVGDGVYAGQTLIIPLGGNTAPTPSPTAPPAPTVAPSPTAAPTQPPAPNPEPTPSPASTGETTHVVLRGETLFSIGLRYGLPWTVIAQANGIIGDRVYAGQTLTIPANFDPNPQWPPPPPPRGGGGGG
jgi:LysM repeat protein